MHMDKEPAVDLIELGSVSADTQGADGVIIETFTLMPKHGISAD